MTSQPARKTPGELLREKGQLADDIIAVMKKANLRGQKFTIRRERPANG